MADEISADPTTAGKKSAPFSLPSRSAPDMRAFVAVAAVAVLLWAIVPTTYPGTPTSLTLLWGDEIAHLDAPDYSVPGIDTPHPLSNMIGTLLSPLGAESADIAASAINYLCLAACAVLIFLLARIWFGAGVAILAPALFLSRPSILASGVDTYRDSLYLALVLGALLVEIRRPRNGVATLGLLVVAGLLRPEAWAFSGLYILYCSYTDRKRFLPLTAFSLLAPLIWLTSDFVLAGDPFFSFTYTQDFAQVLQRDTGLYSAVTLLPARLTDLTSKVLLAAGLFGAAVALAWIPRRSWLCVGLLCLSFLSFVALASVGFSIVGRYLVLSAALISILASVGMIGWLQLHPERRHARLLWAVGGVGLLAATATFVPEWVRAIDHQRADQQLQAQGRDDLRSLVDEGTFDPGCGLIALPSLRQTANVARWTHLRHRSVKTMVLERPRAGYYVLPRDTELDALLRKEMGVQTPFMAPAGFRRVTANRSWLVYRRCRSEL